MDFFDGRENYVNQERGFQYIYENETTGVYFTFDWIDSNDDEEPLDGLNDARPYILFNVNYFRPSYFGLEAAYELNELVDYLNADIRDPQVEGMGDGPFSTQGFLKSYNQGNQYAYRVIKSRQTDAPFVVSQELNEKIWEWNYNSKKFGNSLVDDFFIPTIFFFETEVGFKSAIIHGRNIQTVIPSFVDGVIVGDQNLANKIYGYVHREDLLAKMQTDTFTSGGDKYVYVGQAEDHVFWNWAEDNSIGVSSKLANDSVLDAELYLSN